MPLFDSLVLGTTVSFSDTVVLDLANVIAEKLALALKLTANLVNVSQCLPVFQPASPCIYNCEVRKRIGIQSFLSRLSMF